MSMKFELWRYKDSLSVIEFETDLETLIGGSFF